MIKPDGWQRECPDSLDTIEELVETFSGEGGEIELWSCSSCGLRYSAQGATPELWEAYALHLVEDRERTMDELRAANARLRRNGVRGH